ncbi:MAG TPA: hypothetical protein VFK90_09200 [Anaeromyxobacter sp.]|nr:hypothetical protein [Anaeromyxobacter sp.]
MNRVYLPLLPLPVLAVIVAVSACSKARTEEPTIHVIPPAVAMPAPAPAAAPEAPAPKEAVAARTEEEKPTAQDVKEFERKVRK